MGFLHNTLPLHPMRSPAISRVSSFTHEYAGLLGYLYSVLWYLTVGGRRHTVVAWLGDDPDHATDRVAVTGPHGRQLDWAVASARVEERQLAVLHTAADDGLILVVVVDRRQVMRRLQHQLRTHTVNCTMLHKMKWLILVMTPPCM